MANAEVVSVLFTDSLGWDDLTTRAGPELADAARRDHFELLRVALANHAGKEIKNVGDGLMAVFPSASDAVACAIDMRKAVVAQNEKLAAPIALRVGINAGDAFHEGEDWFGMAVVVAKRLCDAAAPGQVLLADVVRLLAGSRSAVDLQPVGELKLKGVPDPIPAHEAIT